VLLPIDKAASPFSRNGILNKFLNKFRNLTLFDLTIDWLALRIINTELVNGDTLKLDFEKVK
jgi:hypothetical protein